MSSNLSARLSSRYSLYQDTLLSKMASGDGPEAFIAELQSKVRLDGRTLKARVDKSFGTEASVIVNFYNLPEGIGGAGGGAEAENNRMMFQVSGFGNDKIRVELRVSALPREYKLRAKTGTVSQVAKYLADFISMVVDKVEPKFTHTKTAKEFATDRALKKYLHDHPKADPSQHSVRKAPEKKPAAPEKKPSNGLPPEAQHLLDQLGKGDRKRLLEQAIEIGDAKSKGVTPKVLQDLSKEKGFEVLKDLSVAEQRAVIERALGKK